MRDYNRNRIRNRFLARGYPQDTIGSVQYHAQTQNRSELLTTKSQKTNESIGSCTRIIGTYGQRSREVTDVLRRYWNILKADPDLEDALPTHPQVTYRRGCSIRDRLVHSVYNPPKTSGTWLDRKPLGTFRCGKNCVACPFIQQSKTFKKY